MGKRDRTARGTTAGGGDGELQRTLGSGLLTIYGAGTILGAGIYVLIGEVAAEAGWWLPLAFALAAGAASFTGLAYAELSTRDPSAGGPTSYVDEAFDRSWFSALIGWMIVVTGVVSAATIATGFVGYATTFVRLPGPVVAAGLLLLVGLVAAAGARQSAWFMAVTTALGVVGLLVVVGAGLLTGGAEPGRFLAQAPSLGSAGALTGLLSATFLAVYAFIGFEDMVHVAEEVRDPERSMPRGIVGALGIAAVLYVVVAVAALAVLSPSQLADAGAPLVEVVEAAGLPGWPVAVLSLWIIPNGALAQVVMASRVMMSLADGEAVPDRLGRVSNRTGTPLVATAVAVVVAVVLAVALPLAQLASITSFVILLVFAASNAALVVLERRQPEAPFDTARWLPWVGLVLSLGLAVASLFLGGGE